LDKLSTINGSFQCISNKKITQMFRLKWTSFKSQQHPLHKSLQLTRQILISARLLSEQGLQESFSSQTKGKKLSFARKIFLFFAHSMSLIVWKKWSLVNLLELFCNSSPSNSNDFNKEFSFSQISIRSAATFGEKEWDQKYKLNLRLESSI